MSKLISINPESNNAPFVYEYTDNNGSEYIIALGFHSIAITPKIKPEKEKCKITSILEEIVACKMAIDDLEPRGAAYEAEVAIAKRRIRELKKQLREEKEKNVYSTAEE